MEAVLAALYILPVMRSLRYLHPSPLFVSSDLQIRGIGVREAMPPCFIERPRGTADYLFMLFYDPVEFGRVRQPLPADTMVMWDRTSPHFYGCPARRWQHSWIHCDGRAVRQIRRSLDIRGDRLVCLADPSVVDRQLLDMHTEIGRGAAADAVIVRNLLENFVRSASRGDEGVDRRLVPPTGIVAARVHLESHYDRSISLSDLAAVARSSPRHFCTEFRRHIGVSPMAYLTRLRLQTAAALLRGTAEPVGEIGRRVGFRDPYHFSKRFRAHFGVTPTQLRTARGNR